MMINSRERSIIHLLFILSALLCLTGCAWKPSSPEYQQMYSYASQIPYCQKCEMDESEFFLIFLVEARHLDYTDNHSLCRTLAKHPTDGSKNGDVGHAWIYLQGIVDGEVVVVEGGHSGELGLSQPKYFDGIMNYVEYGCASPSQEEIECPRDEPNPIKYLWASQYDGFFQQGSGNHTPTFAAKIDLTKEQFLQILRFIDPYNYHYPDYAITRNQCSSFVSKVGSLVDFYIECNVTMQIGQTLVIGGRSLRLWEDPEYSCITFSSPDVIECSLVDAVCEGRAEYALDWYKRHHGKCAKERFRDMCKDLSCFPSRILKVICLY